MVWGITAGRHPENRRIACHGVAPSIEGTNFDVAVSHIQEHSTISIVERRVDRFRFGAEERDPRHRRRSIDASEIHATPLGDYRVSPENGAQLGFKPLLVQIRKGRPEFGPPLLPYPQWNERALIK